MSPSLGGMRQDGVANGFDAIVQGELAVGAATVQITADFTACKGVWVGAPTTSHTEAAVNDGPILIGGASGGNASGGMTLATDNALGFLILTNNVALLYFTGFNAGDVVEYQYYT